MNKVITIIFILVLIGVGAYFLIDEDNTNTSYTESISEVVAYTNENGEEWSIPTGEAVYNISNDPDTWPKFIKAEIDPLQVYPGETQNMKVVLQNDASIDSVVAHVETDNGIREIEMNQVDSGEVTREDIENRPYLVDEDGTLVINNQSTSERVVDSLIDKLFNRAIAQETTQYTFEADWVVEDTHETTYTTEFVAVDSEGRQNTHTMAWSDPWNGLRDYGTGDDTIASGGTVPRTLNSGTDVSSGIRGLERGNISFSGSYNITIQNSTFFIWNPGYSITLNNGGSFTVQDGGKFRKGYIYLADEDTDGAGISMTKKYHYNSTPCPSGSAGDISITPKDSCQVKCHPDADDTCIDPPSNLRRAGYVNGQDCADNDSQTYPGQTNWFSSEGGNGFDYNCDGNEEEELTRVSDCDRLVEEEDNDKSFAENILSNFKSEVLASGHYYGWLGMPSCGNIGYWNQNASSCGNQIQKTQRCR